MGRGFGGDEAGGNIGRFDALRQRIERLFEEDGEGRRGGGVWVPVVDICDEGETFVVTAEIPGMALSDIDVEIVGDRLVLRGERTGGPEEGPRTFHRMERPEGPFQRSFRLPDEVDPAGVKATYKEGVLTVTLPKKAARPATGIPIE